jgi:UDPglucose--hexose-1-phosphate uridylyltransferase
MAIEFKRAVVEAQFQSPDGAAVLQRRTEVRFDPLLGNSARIAEGVKLQTADPKAVESFQQQDQSCPFCPERVAKLTPKIMPQVYKEGYIRVGGTVLFPNFVPYSQYAAVAVFSPRHWLALTDFTAELIRDNLTAVIRYVRGVYAYRNHCAQCAYNINYLYPSGGSLLHPHSQVFLDPHPTTIMRLQQQASEAYMEASGRCFWEELAETETTAGIRAVMRLGRVAWFTPFAPLGFNEVRAVLVGRETLLDLDDTDIAHLADGIGRVLAWYSSIGYNSFNLVLYSGPLGGSRSYRVNLAMITRTALVPFYRSDSMYLERLHWEAAVDRTPEDVAKQLREYLPGA